MICDFQSGHSIRASKNHQAQAKEMNKSKLNKNDLSAQDLDLSLMYKKGEKKYNRTNGIIEQSSMIERSGIIEQKEENSICLCLEMKENRHR